MYRLEVWYPNHMSAPKNLDIPYFLKKDPLVLFSLMVWFKGNTTQKCHHVFLMGSQHVCTLCANYRTRAIISSGLYIFYPIFEVHLCTLKSLIEEHACLNFSDFHSALLAIFHVINKKFHPARLLIYLVNKQAGWHFFPTLLVYSGLLVY